MFGGSNTILGGQEGSLFGGFMRCFGWFGGALGDSLMVCWILHGLYWVF